MNHERGKVWLKDGYLVEHSPTGRGIRRYWSPSQIEMLRRRFPYEDTGDLSIDLGFNESAVRRKAKELGIKKDREYVHSLCVSKARMLKHFPKYERKTTNYIATYLKNETEEQKKERFEKIRKTKTSAYYRATHKMKRTMTPEKREAWIAKLREVRRRAIENGAVEKFRETINSKPKALRERTRRKQSESMKKTLHEKRVQNQGA